MTAPFDWTAHNASPVMRHPASLQRKAAEAIKRRPDLQSAWLAVMNGPDLRTTEAANSTAHLATLTPERRAELNKDWLA